MSTGPGGRAALYAPRPVDVELTGTHPRAIAGSRVEAIREQWLVEDRWWSSRPLRRHYFEAVLASGRCVVVFCDLDERRWYEQR